MKKRVGVIGVGSAGIVTLSKLLSSLSNDWDVVSIHDPSTPILGIGESTNPSFIRVLELGTRFSLMEDIDKLDSTLKYGTMFQGWREKDWLNPLLSGGVAVHFNTFELKEFAMSRFKALWPEKFKVIEGKVENIDNTVDNVTLTINGKDEVFDFIVDCGGFPTESTDYVRSTCSLMNHCLVFSFKEFDPIQYTEHIATPHGWMFGIPLLSRKTYGYMFNDEITSIDDAKKDMASRLNISVEEIVNSPEFRTYTFVPYYTTRFANKRVLKNGNRALFFEPISATSINQYIATCDLIVQYILNGINEHEANTEFINQSNITEDIINFYYHGGTNYNSEFWKAAKANALKNLEGNSRFNFMLDRNQHAMSIGLPYNGKAHLFSNYSLVIMDEAFGYNYFKGAKRPFSHSD